MIRNIYFRLFGLELYAEHPSVTRGQTFFDFMSDRGELLVWAGRLHIVVTPPWWKLAKAGRNGDGPSIAF